MEMKMFKVGDEVVVFFCDRPMKHNSGKYPCRGKILKVGEDYYMVSSLKSPIKVFIGEHELMKLHTVEEARELQKKNFSGPNEWRSKEMIKDILSRL